MRQYKLFVCVIQVLLGAGTVSAGFDRVPQPSALIARGFAGGAKSDAVSLWVNPAVIAADTASRLFIFYTPSPFGLKALSNFGAVLALPVSFGAVAVGYSGFGTALYKEQSFSFTGSMKVALTFSAGVSVTINHVAIDRYGSATVAVFDGGLVHFLSEKISFGMAIQNFTGTSVNGGEEIPQSMIIASCFELSAGTRLIIDLVKDVRYPAEVRSGVEFAIFDVLTIRGGCTDEPSRITGGISVRSRSVIFDYAAVTHRDLGITHSFGISMEW